MRIHLAFLMDCTASMEEWIQAAKDRIHKIVDSTRAQHGNDIQMRVGFVGYRDYGDSVRYIVQDFTDVATLLERIRDVHAEGGDDCAEDVAGGLLQIKHLTWNDGDVKILVHITDAPPHGLQFHARNVSDRFPAGDPEGINPLTLITQLYEEGIDYTCIKINRSTDTMIEQFSNCYLNSSRFTVLDLQVQNLRQRGHIFEETLSATITASITQYTCSQDPATVEHTAI